MHDVPLPTQNGKFRDLSGEKFGRLTALAFVGHYGPRRRLMWRCRCDCGELILATGTAMTTGHTKSCGCWLADQAKLNLSRKTHGHWSGMRATPEYSAWQSMKQRCSNPNDIEYRNYGGRGIAVCERWLGSFENFLADMGNRPSPQHSMDRVDVDGNYTPENCRWADTKTQAFNRRNNQKVVIDGQEMLLAHAVDRAGVVPVKLVRSRLSKGWPLEAAITTPRVAARDRLQPGERRE